MSFDTRVLWQSIPFLQVGLETTVLLVLGSLAIGICLGAIACAGRLLGRGLLYRISTAYVGLCRGLPEIVLIFWIYYCGPLVFDVSLTDVESALATLSIISGAYLAEIFRAGVEAVPRGQIEAGRALGLSEFWVGWSIVIPQAVRVMVPALVGFVTILLKNTALVSAIGVTELFYEANVFAGQTLRYLEILTAVGVIYFCLIFPLSLVVQHSERRLATRTR
jgi:His/Glu/Gln/Arg/opine family amino acid ABC transporter permease subunit